MIARVGTIALRVLACVLLGVAALLLLLVLTLVSSRVALLLHATPLALELTRALPGWLAYWGVVASPLGGVFRTDFFLVALALCVASRLIVRLAKGIG